MFQRRKWKMSENEVEKCQYCGQFSIILSDGTGYCACIGVLRARIEKVEKLLLNGRKMFGKGCKIIELMVEVDKAINILEGRDK